MATLYNIKSILEEPWKNNLYGTRQHYQLMLCLCSIMFHVRVLKANKNILYFMTFWEKYNREIFTLNVDFHEL